MSTVATAQTEDFYSQRLADGILANRSGDYPLARRELSTAAFGLLDRPNELARALVHLAIAEHRSRNANAVRVLFHRVVEVETRFEAYSQSTLSMETRRDFETALQAAVPADQIANTKTFGHLAMTAAREDLERLEPKALKRTLEQRRATDPQNPEWDIRMADVLEREGQDKEAIDALGAAISKLEEPQHLYCRQGQLQSITESCAEAVQSLEQCPLRFAQPNLAAAAIGCLRSLDRSDEAKQWLANLPPTLRSHATVEQRTVGLLAEGETLPEPSSPKSPSSATEASIAVADAQGPSSLAETSTASVGLGEVTAPSAAQDGAEFRTPATGLPAPDLEELARSKALGRNAETPEQIDAAFEAAQAVAQRNPTSRAAQYNAAQLAYRASRFAEATRYFDRGGQLGEDQTTLLFYQAVSLFEQGELVRARETLQRALPRLIRNSFVDSYVARILPETGTAQN